MSPPGLCSIIPESVARPEAICCYALPFLVKLHGSRQLQQVIKLETVEGLIGAMIRAGFKWEHPLYQILFEDRNAKTDSFNELMPLQIKISIEHHGRFDLM